MPQQPSKKTVGRIEITCPHCRSSQSESAYAKSTICRQCGQYFDLGKLAAGKRAFKVAGENDADNDSFFSRVGKLFSSERIRKIHCFRCGAEQSISSSAKSSMCSQCNGYLDLKDFKIAALFTRNIETQGTVEITAKGEVSSPKIVCGTALIKGKMRGNLVCSGTARIKFDGKIYGAIEAHRLIIEKRTNVEFVRPIKASVIEIHGKTTGRVIGEGRVEISKRGSLDGTIYAKSIQIDKGGIFHGELFIGQYELQQQELLSRESETDLSDAEKSDSRIGITGK